MPYPVTIESDEYQPVPASWVSHPRAYDRDLRAGPALLAVSATTRGSRTLRVRYAHPTTHDVLVCQTAAVPHGEGVVPAALANGSGWPRSLRPGPSDPADTLRGCEIDHLEAIWSDISERVGRTFEPAQRAVAGGGR